MAQRKDEISGLELGLALSSFIPFLGVLLGVGAIVAGSNKLKNGGIKLILLAAVGIMVGTVGGIVLVKKIVFNKYATSGFSQGIQQTIAKNYLKETVMALEYYKVVHGAYPVSLDELKGEGIHFLHDGSAGTDLNNIGKQHTYILQADGLHFQLMDTGPDGVTGTADDVLPVMSPEELQHTGYLNP